MTAASPRRSVIQAAQTAEIVADLKPPEITELVLAQISLPAYLSAPLEHSGRAVPRYRRNEDLWADVLDKKLNAAAGLILEGFQLNEWMPFSAGTFHTDYGRSEREHARQMILYDGTTGTRQPRPELKTLVRGLDTRSLGQATIYSSAGKGGMIAGGIGSVRLKPRRLGNEDVWFLSATSSSSAHEGFVVALPADLYRRHADEIAQTGSVRCTLTGELRFVDNEFRARYGYGVPQLYLLVSDIAGAAGAKSRLRVSVPVSFQGADGSVNAAYANFWPDEPDGLERATRWLEQTYVEGIYNGQVVTDFDEQIRWFKHAELSLEKVMDATLGPQEAGDLARRLGLGEHMATVIIERVEVNGTLSVGRADTVHQDRIINIGGNAQVGNVVIANEIKESFNNIQQLPDTELREQLEQLANAVNEAVRATSAPEARTLGTDLDALTEELARDEPRKARYTLSLERLAEAAGKIGAIGLPILEIAAKISALV